MITKPRVPHAVATMPRQPPAGASLARTIGAGVLSAVAIGLVGAALFRMFERRPAKTPAAPHARSVKRLGATASILSLSVLADSGLEHYRGAFQNPAMYVAPLAATATLTHSLQLTGRPNGTGRAGRWLSVIAFITGITGTGYHIYNLLKREGGIDWLNLFYGAPIGAPIALSLAGLAGLAADQLAHQKDAEPTLLGRPAGPVLAVGAAAGLLGTVAEAGLLHFRGAYHNPAMYVPVSLPPIAAAALLASLLAPSGSNRARRLLRATAAAGLAGVGFHAYGISRNMGGFYNWSQNILNGPPLPAPPAFTGVAIAGLTALDLMERAT